MGLGPPVCIPCRRVMDYSPIYEELSYEELQSRRAQGEVFPPPWSCSCGTTVTDGPDKVSSLFCYPESEWEKMYLEETKRSIS